MSTTSVETLSTIDQLQLYVPGVGQPTVAMVKDPARGGTFIYETGVTTSAVTEGVITYLAYPSSTPGTPASGTWTRQFQESDGVNVLWAGAKGDTVIAKSGTMAINSRDIYFAPADFNFTSAVDNGKRVIIPASRKSVTLGFGTTYVDLITKITNVDAPNYKITVSNAVLPDVLNIGLNRVTGGSLTASTNYKYVVVALDSTGNCILRSNNVAVSTTSTLKTVVVSWGRVQGAVKYRVFRYVVAVPDPPVTCSYYEVAAANLDPAHNDDNTFTDTGAAPLGTMAIPTDKKVKITYGTDDTAAIQKVLNLPYNVLFPANYTFLNSYGLFGDGITNTSFPPNPDDFYPATPVALPNSALIGNRTIFAHGSTIVRSNNSFMMRWQGPQLANISVEGGTWTCPNPIQGAIDIYTDASPTNPNTGTQGCFSFTGAGTNNINVSKTHILGSPETGISFSHCIVANVEGNSIENCYRDGIYSQYSAFLKYVNNSLFNIKDDAMSIHDYGDPTIRTVLNYVGLQQAGESIVSGNIVRNAYQGFSSVGAAGLSIFGNEISNTVNSAINAHNNLDSASLIYRHYIESGTRIGRININNNVCRNNCSPTKIMGMAYDSDNPNGYNGPNRAAIVIGSYVGLDTYLQPRTTELLLIRANNIIIDNNKIFDADTCAICASQVDELTISNNYSYNANAGNHPGTDYSNDLGNTYDVNFCTQVSILNNQAIDDRTTAYKTSYGSITANILPALPVSGVNNRFTRYYTGATPVQQYFYPSEPFTVADVNKKIIITGAYNDDHADHVYIKTWISADEVDLEFRPDSGPWTPAYADFTLPEYGSTNSEKDFANAIYGDFTPAPKQKRGYGIRFSSGYMDFWTISGYTLEEGLIMESDMRTYVSQSIGFTPENAAKKDASNGYAGLTSGKIAGAQIPDLFLKYTGGILTGDVQKAGSPVNTNSLVNKGYTDGAVTYGVTTGITTLLNTNNTFTKPQSSWPQTISPPGTGSYAQNGFISAITGAQYTAGARPGYSFLADGIYGTSLYAAYDLDLRLIGNSGATATILTTFNTGLENDSVIVTACTTANFTASNPRTITPSGSKIFKKGKMLAALGYLYIAIEDNYVARVLLS